MRDAGFSRQRYWGEPFPIMYLTPASSKDSGKDDDSKVLFPGGDSGDVTPFPLSENELPVILPEVESYKPTGDGESPLAMNLHWKNMPDGSFRETDTMPGYAGYSWDFLRYMDPEN